MVPNTLEVYICISVCIFLSVNSEFPLSIVHAYRDGRYIIVEVNIGDEQLSVINVYAPDAEQELLIRSLGVNLISKTDITKISITGD